eukprot:TRINITY_DN37193_c0_g2_i1.p1 TRINITY_DN37193_c0_g2~~TRINITY_DN37193_c0_g2_i1.p1  ORF type:complete len:468 (+),score=138.73 TRINITY_DN37193_c0_g2_i1:197-1405(+)
MDESLPPQGETLPPREPAPGWQQRRVTLLVPWWKKKLAATTPAVPPECPVRDCRVIFRALGKRELELQQIAEADVVFFDTNGKMKEDRGWYDPEVNPQSKTLALLNIENVWGRMPAWGSKWKVKWFAKANSTGWWRRFSLTGSYEEHAMLRYRYWHTLNRTELGRHYSPRLKDKRAGGGRAALFIASNCWTRLQTNEGYDRDQLVRDLARHWPVEALGDCLNKISDSKRRPDVFNSFGCDRARPHKKQCLISRYPFYLSFENSRSVDYVTEKVYEPLLVGTVPVYVGAPNIENFLPTSRCAVLARDFPSLAALAHYLRCLIARPQLYEHYTRWRERPRLPSWDARFEDPADYPLCRACTLVAQNATQLYDPEQRLPRPEPAVRPEARGSQQPFAECLPPEMR